MPCPDNVQFITITSDTAKAWKRIQISETSLIWQVSPWSLIHPAFSHWAVRPQDWRNTPAGVTSSQKLRKQSSAWKIINHKDDSRFWCSVLHRFAHVAADSGHSWKQQGCEVVSSNLVSFYTCWAQSYRTSNLVYICSSHFIATFNPQSHSFV